MGILYTPSIATLRQLVYLSGEYLAMFPAGVPSSRCDRTINAASHSAPLIATSLPQIDGSQSNAQTCRVYLYGARHCARAAKAVKSASVHCVAVSEIATRLNQSFLGRFLLKVVISGGAGLIGSHLCARLLQEGHNVWCVDNLLTGSRRNIETLAQHPQFHFLQHDVTLPLEMDTSVDAIFHLASPASPVGYWTYPFETIRANTEGTWRLLDLARASNARFLVASTSEAYGDPLVHPQREDYWGNVNPVGVRACYDESKRLAETITMEFHRQYGVDVRIARIFNTYGPHNQLNDGRMIPNFIMWALANEPIVIHGTGLQTRSICYVDDLVDGLLRAMFTDGTTAEIFNLGNPEEHTVTEWAQLIIELCGSTSELVFEEKREDDPERRRPDIAKAKLLLGWQPKTDPRTGLMRTIEWFRSERERDTSPAAANAKH
jgi:nucleoside-diphosphate-sugar epimerase